MSDEHGTLREIAWLEVFPGLKLFSALRMAFNFRALLLAAVAVIGTVAGWRICGELFRATSDAELQAEIKINSAWPWEGAYPGKVLENDQAAVATAIGPRSPLEAWLAESSLPLAWQSISLPFERIYAPGASFSHFVYWLACALWSLAVWAFFGGAISRMAAVSVARQENLSWGQLSGFVRSRWPSYFAAPLFPILGTFLAAIFLGLLGLFMRAGAGLLLAGIVWPLALLAGFAMAFLLIGLAFGWPLMWGAISAEGTDAFGALSHSYSYTYQRPFHYLMYAVGATLLGVLGWYLVSLFATFTVLLTSWGVSWGSGAAPIDAIAGGEELGMLGDPGAALIRFWNGCVIMLTLAWTFSYLWTSTTVIYFLLRRHVDATEMDVVFLPEEQQRHGLPQLKTGPDGVPAVADDPVLSADESS